MTSSSGWEYIIISKSEMKSREKELFFSAQEIETLIENKDTVVKFIKKTIHKIQSDLWNFLRVWKEWEAYTQVIVLKELIESLENITPMYKQLREQQEKEKEEENK